MIENNFNFKPTKIPKIDKHGTQLYSGDIVAEGTLGKFIWNDQGEIVRRPLGIIVANSVNNTVKDNPDEEDYYSVLEIRQGAVALTDTAEEFIKSRSESNYTSLHLTIWDGYFCAWDNIEKIGSVFDLNK